VIVETEREILAKAIEKWGPVKQINKAIEELGELVIALARQGSRRNLDNIAEEIADVRIMLDQLEMIFGVNAFVKRIREEKLERLEKRL
jgi:NTP pyrophosphatase (non-canonical NTP hydrolase)